MYTCQLLSSYRSDPAHRRGLGSSKPAHVPDRCRLVTQPGTPRNMMSIATIANSGVRGHWVSSRWMRFNIRTSCRRGRRVQVYGCHRRLASTSRLTFRPVLDYEVPRADADCADRRSRGRARSASPRRGDRASRRCDRARCAGDGIPRPRELDDVRARLAIAQGGRHRRRLGGVARGRRRDVCDQVDYLLVSD